MLRKELVKVVHWEHALLDLKKLCNKIIPINKNFRIYRTIMYSLKRSKEIRTLLYRLRIIFQRPLHIVYYISNMIQFKGIF